MSQFFSDKEGEMDEKICDSLEKGPVNVNCCVGKEAVKEKVDVEMCDTGGSPQRSTLPSSLPVLKSGDKNMEKVSERKSSFDMAKVDNKLLMKTSSITISRLSLPQHSSPKEGTLKSAKSEKDNKRKMRETEKEEDDDDDICEIIEPKEEPYFDDFATATDATNVDYAIDTSHKKLNSKSAKAFMGALDQDFEGYVGGFGYSHSGSDMSEAMRLVAGHSTFDIPDDTPEFTGSFQQQMEDANFQSTSSSVCTKGDLPNIPHLEGGSHGSSSHNISGSSSSVGRCGGGPVNLFPVFTCPYCQRNTFKQRSDLNRHIRIHTGEKPFKCPYCDYSSAQSAPLKSHIFRKHKDMPYVSQQMM